MLDFPENIFYKLFVIAKRNNFSLSSCKVNKSVCEVAKHTTYYKTYLLYFSRYVFI